MKILFYLLNVDDVVIDVGCVNIDLANEAIGFGLVVRYLECKDIAGLQSCQREATPVLYRKDIWIGDRLAAGRIGPVRLGLVADGIRSDELYYVVIAPAVDDQFAGI